MHEFSTIRFTGTKLSLSCICLRFVSQQRAHLWYGKDKSLELLHFCRPVLWQLYNVSEGITELQKAAWIGRSYPHICACTAAGAKLKLCMEGNDGIFSKWHEEITWEEKMEDKILGERLAYSTRIVTRKFSCDGHNHFLMLLSNRAELSLCTHTKMYSAPYHHATSIKLSTAMKYWLFFRRFAGIFGGSRALVGARKLRFGGVTRVIPWSSYSLYYVTPNQRSLRTSLMVEGCIGFGPVHYSLMPPLALGYLLLQHNWERDWGGDEVKGIL